MKLCNDGGIYDHLVLVKYSHFLAPTADRKKKKLLITKDVLKIVLKSSVLLPELLLILTSF